MKLRILSIILIMATSTFSFAKVTSPKSQIDRLITYSKYGRGDTYISLQQNDATCVHGYFVNKESEGYQAMISILISAYHAGSPVRIYAYDNNRWEGSSNPVCEMYSVELRR